LLCNETVSVNKEYSLKRHFTSRHADDQKIDGQLRKDEIQKLKKNLVTQQQMFNKQHHYSIVKASFCGKRKKSLSIPSFCEGDFIKECLVDVASMKCPLKKKRLRKYLLMETNCCPTDRNDG
jgi:hypothetical protein